MKYFGYIVLLCMICQSCGAQNKWRQHLLDESEVMEQLKPVGQQIDTMIIVLEMLNRLGVEFKSNLDSQKPKAILQTDNFQQAGSFFRMLNAAVQSEEKYTFLMLDKETRKIVDLSRRKENTEVFVGMCLEEFKERFKNGQIEFRLMDSKFFKKISK